MKARASSSDIAYISSFISIKNVSTWMRSLLLVYCERIVVPEDYSWLLNRESNCIWSYRSALMAAKNEMDSRAFFI